MKTLTNGSNSAELLELTDQSMDWQEVWHVLLEKSWIIAICAIVGFFAATAYVKRIPVTYRATAVLQYDADDRKVLDFEDGTRQDLAKDAEVQTILEAFRSRSLLGKVVETEKLNENPEFMPMGSNGAPQSVSTAAAVLAGCIDVQERKGTRLIDVTSNHHNPRIAQQLADAMARQFLNLTVEQRASSSKAVLQFLESEADRYKAKLQQSEEAIQDYKESQNAASLEERQDTVIGKLKSQSNQLSEAKATRIRLGTEYEEVKKYAGNPEGLLSLASVASDPAIASLKQKISGIESRIATLALRYTDKHPKMIQAKSELAEAKAALSQTAKTLPNLIHSEYERAVATEIDFEHAVREQEKQALALSKQAIKYNVLLRDLDTDRVLYESLLRRMKETDVAKGVDTNNLRVFESAALPQAPIDRKANRFLLMGLFGGLMLGVGSVSAGHFMNGSWKTVDQAESATSLPVLASVPRCRRVRPTMEGSPVLGNPSSSTAEAFRFLRTSLQKVARKEGHMTFLFASALPAEGKTLCAVNYAITCAQQGLKTLIIDGDLRSSMIASILLGKQECPGIAEFVAEEQPLSNYVHETTVPNLFVLPAGKSMPHPAEMLATLPIARMIAEARHEFDCIVIDSAPLLSVSDTLIIVEYADAVCLVVRAGSTDRKSVLRACHLLSEFGVKPVGLVMNAVPTRRVVPYYCAAGAYGKRGYRARTSA